MPFGKDKNTSPQSKKEKFSIMNPLKKLFGLDTKGQDKNKNFVKNMNAMRKGTELLDNSAATSRAHIAPRNRRLPSKQTRMGSIHTTSFPASIDKVNEDVPVSKNEPQAVSHSQDILKASSEETLKECNKASSETIVPNPTPIDAIKEEKEEAQEVNNLTKQPPVKEQPTKSIFDQEASKALPNEKVTPNESTPQVVENAEKPEREISVFEPEPAQVPKDPPQHKPEGSKTEKPLSTTTLDKIEKNITKPSSSAAKKEIKKEDKEKAKPDIKDCSEKSGVAENVRALKSATEYPESKNKPRLHKKAVTSSLVEAVPSKKHNFPKKLMSLDERVFQKSHVEITKDKPSTRLDETVKEEAKAEPAKTKKTEVVPQKKPDAAKTPIKASPLANPLPTPSARQQISSSKIFEKATYEARPKEDEAKKEQEANENLNFSSKKHLFEKIISNETKSAEKNLLASSKHKTTNRTSKTPENQPLAEAKKDNKIKGKP